MDDFLSRLEVARGDARKLQLVLERFEADTGTIHRLGQDGLLHLEAWAGHIPDELLPLIRTIPIGKGIAGLAVERGEPVDMCNLQTNSSADARPRAKETGVKGSICVPMKAGHKVVGALGIATVRERKFQPEEIEGLLGAAGAVAAGW